MRNPSMRITDAASVRSNDLSAILKTRQNVYAHNILPAYVIGESAGFCSENRAICFDLYISLAQ